MASNTLAFMTGLGTGYLGAKEKAKDRERQARLDAQAQELHDARMYELGKGKRREEALAAAYKETPVNDSAVTLDVSGKPVLYEDAGVANSDYRQARMLQEQAPAPMAAPMAAQGMPLEIAPLQAAPMPAAIAAPKPTFAAGGVQYADRAAAQAGADAYNTTDAGNQRAAKALRGMGDPAAAAQLEASTRQGKLADIQLTQAEEAQVHDKAFREVTDQFSRQGWNALPKIYENYNDGKTAKVVEDGKGGAVVSVFNEKGEPVGQRAFKSEMDFITDAVAKLDPKVWVTMKAKQASEERAQGNWDKTHQLAVDSKGESRRHNMAMEGLASQRAARAGAGGSGSGGKAGDGTGAGTVDFNPLANFDSKKAQDTAFSEAVKESERRVQAGKPAMTPKQMGDYGQQIYRGYEDAYAGENQARHVESTVAKSLRAAKDDPTQYAETFAKAKKLGMDDKQLASMGFTAPLGDTPASAAVKVPPGSKATAAEKRAASQTSIENPFAGKSAAAPAPAPAPAASKQQQMKAAYDTWQSLKSKNSTWYGGKGQGSPGSMAAEAQAEAAYLELLRNQ